jgi:hypothetical protein
VSAWGRELIDRIPGSLFRLFILCAFIVAIGMIRPRLTSERAGWVLVGCGIVTALALTAFVLSTARVAHRLPMVAGGVAAFTAVRVSLRRVGLPLLALAFFLFWTFVYLGLWWFRPDGTFSGLAEMPRFADFFYYAVMTALTSPPEDIVAVSRGARSATMIEILTGLALLTTYLSALFEWRRGGPARRIDEPDTRPR